MERSLEDDDALARRIVAGDASAEAAFCERMAPRIHAYGMRQKLGAAASADLVQQALLVVIEALRAGRIADTSRVAGFVFGACRNLLRDQRKGEARRGRLLAEVEPVLASIAAEMTPPRMELDRLEGCLDKLAAREKTIVVATFWRERSGDDLARELGTTAQNVRVIRHRALKQLRACLGGA